MSSPGSATPTWTSRRAHASENGCDHLVAEDEHGSNGPHGAWLNLIAPASAQLLGGGGLGGALGGGGNLGGSMGGSLGGPLSDPTSGINRTVRGSAKAVTLTGGAVLDLNGGLLYAPKAPLSLDKTSQIKRGAIVVDTLKMSISGTITGALAAAPVVSSSVSTAIVSTSPLLVSSQPTSLNIAATTTSSGGASTTSSTSVSTTSVSSTASATTQRTPDAGAAASANPQETLDEPFDLVLARNLLASRFGSVKKQ